jgi:phage repressor protein C with HTH and peptisase S24 domain
MESIVARLKQYLDFIGVNTSNAEIAIGVSNGSLSKPFKSETTIKTDTLEKFLKTYADINSDWLLRGKGNIINDTGLELANEPRAVYKLKTDRSIKDQRVPLYDIEATAGMVELFRNKNGKTKPVDFISIPNLPKCDGAIYVTGDSMYPLLKSGDIVMYKELNNSIDNIFFGEMYLISINMDGEEFVTVKWIHKSDKGDEHIKIVSQNSHHQAKDVHLSNIKALALIKASIRINSMS